MNGQDTILHRSLDAVVVDEIGESEGPREGADRAFGDPVLGFGLFWLLGMLRLLLLGDLGGAFSALIGILDSCLVAVGTLDGALSGCIFDETGWGGTRGVAVLGAAFDGQGVAVGELDVDVLLLNAGKFAVKLESGLRLNQVPFGGECLQVGACGVFTTTNPAVSIKVVQHSEEGLERVYSRVGIDESAWKVRHLACLFCWCSEKNSLEW